MNPEISIIIPVYNSEKYLSRCIDSILDNTFKNYELILIDDGSTDSSASICDYYSDKDERIIVIHTENKGISSARNTGIDKAQGKYVMFCDNDDTVESKWIETLLHYIKMYPNFLVNCEYVKTNLISGEKEYPRLELNKENNILPLSDYYLLYKTGYSPYIWIRIYSLRIIKENRIKFSSFYKVGGEDVEFNIDYMKYCNGFVYIPFVGYNWIDNGGSASRNYDSDYYTLLKRLYYIRKPYIAKEYWQEFIDEYFYRVFSCLRLTFNSQNRKSKKEKIKYCNYILKDNCFNEIMNMASTNACSKKLKIILKTHNYRIVDKMINI